MWDDHDYGENNAGGDSPSRSAARLAYQLNIPHYPLQAVDTNSSHPAVSCVDARAADEATRFDDRQQQQCGQPLTNAAIYQAFTVGRVRFVLTDLRSECSAGSMLGEEQYGWFRRELRNASSYALMVWVNSKPWIGKDYSSEDGWSAHAQERRAISNLLLEHNVTNLVALTGDSHMLAIDDGTNTDYSTAEARERYGQTEESTTGAGFPLFNAAPLANTGSAKSGTSTRQ